MRLLLVSNSTQHGGGYLEHCRAEIATVLDAAREVLFIPYALHDHDGYAARARAAFGQMGRRLRSAHESARPLELLAAADAVLVGGGNTFRLLKALYETGLLDAIRARAEDGMPYVGTSAGANVACPSIRTTNDMPIVYPPSFDALALVPFNINPHYLDPDPASRHMGETRETRIREFHEENSPPVVGLREGSMLRREDRTLTLLGTTGARLFEAGRDAVEYAPGSDLSFLL
jgi:dipeptidase E